MILSVHPRCHVARRRMGWMLWLVLGLISVGIAAVEPASAAKPQPRTMFALITNGFAAPRKLQFCGFVAQQAADQAGEAADPALRAARLAAARHLQARLATGLAKANAGLDAETLKGIEQENGQAVGLLSFGPSERLAGQIKAGGQNDIIGLFLADILGQCDGLLDGLGIPALPLAADAALPPPSFEWRGKTAEQAFAGTSLGPLARKMCGGAETAAADFAGAKLAERGADGVSLLDWAIACRDRAAFAALLDAGFDAASPGEFGDPPMVVAVEEKDLWFVEALLTRRVSPDAMGHWQTALSAAYEPLEDGGGTLFKRLRSAGASLEFPQPEKSMWDTWSLFARWEMILANWSVFKSDPVALGRSVTIELDMPCVRGSKRDLEEIKRRLQADFGVCFPVGALLDVPVDARGFYIQPACPKQGGANRAASARP